MIIKIDNLDYIYNQETPFEKIALDNINLEIEEGEFIGLIGHTGSGKSTLVQHLNGLIRVQSGKLYIDGFDISKKETKLKKIRQKVGLVFQYPEYQLFEETIYKDIAFGPKNLGLNEDEIKIRVIEAMEIVGLDYESLKDRSPFELSGGQKRRVAIAGVVAMKPKVLVLDEPTAGLDPHGRDEILTEIFDLFKKGGITVVLVSHNMYVFGLVCNNLFFVFDDLHKFFYSFFSFFLPVKPIGQLFYFYSFLSAFKKFSVITVFIHVIFPFLCFLVIKIE